MRLLCMTNLIKFVIYFSIIISMSCKKSLLRTSSTIPKASGSETSLLNNWLNKTHIINLTIYLPPKEDKDKFIKFGNDFLKEDTLAKLNNLLEQSSKCISDAFAYAGFPKVNFTFNLVDTVYLDDKQYSNLYISCKGFSNG